MKRLEQRIAGPLPEAMVAAIEVLEAVKEKLGAVEVVVGCGGNKVEIVLARQAMGGGTRAEKYVEVRYVNSETVELHGEERPELFLAVDGLLRNGVYINGRLVGAEGSFSSLLQEAVEEPFVRIVEPEVPLA